MVGGWGQVPGKDGANIDALFGRRQSVQVVPAIAAKIDWTVIQLDVKKSFLFADIEDEVFVEAASGFKKTYKDGVQLPMKLGRSIYGPAQSPGNW